MDTKGQMTTNKSGGAAVATGSQHSLAQFILTGTFGATFACRPERFDVADESGVVSQVINLATDPACDAVYLGKLALFSHEYGRMRDMTALLLAVIGRFHADVFRRVIAYNSSRILNAPIIRKMVQVFRSGKLGSKSIPHCARRAITTWLNCQHPNRVARGAVGNSPSLGDVVKMVHPRPDGPEREALFAWLTGQDSEKWLTKDAPTIIHKIEAWKNKVRDEDGDLIVPKTDFRLLAGAGLDAEQRRAIARSSNLVQTIRSLQQWLREEHVLNEEVVSVICERLRDRDAILEMSLFPFDVANAYYQLVEMPGSHTLGGERELFRQQFAEALAVTLEVSLESAPQLAGDTVVMIDTSGSMAGPSMGYQAHGNNNSASCMRVAAVFTAAIMRQNPTARVIAFDHRAKFIDFDKRTVPAMAARLERELGGGTSCSSAVDLLLGSEFRPKNVIMISDNESWSCRRWRESRWQSGGSTHMTAKWREYLRAVPDANLTLIDITPGTSTQVPDEPRTRTVGGLSAAVFQLLSNGLATGESLVSQVERMDLPA
jgi:60 kDa SS-A/Ro ribonucleoprotein